MDRRRFLALTGEGVAGVAAGGALTLAACGGRRVDGGRGAPADPADRADPASSSLARRVLSPAPRDRTADINRALVEVGVGGMVLLEPGEYRFDRGHIGVGRDPSGAPLNLLTGRTLASADPEARAELRTRYIPAGPDCSHWDPTRKGFSVVPGDGAVVRDLVITGPGMDSVACTAGIDSGRRREGYAVRHCEIRYFRSGINTGNDCLNLDVSDCHVHHNTFTGIQVGNGSHGARIRRCDVHRNGANGIDLNGLRFRVQDNHCHHNGARPGSDRNGIFVYAGRGPQTVSGAVTGNRCHDNARAGIMVAATNGGVARDVVMIDNLCRANGEVGIIVEGREDRRVGGGVADITIRGNRIHDNPIAFYAFGPAHQGTNRFRGNDLCSNTRSVLIDGSVRRYWVVEGNHCG